MKQTKIEDESEYVEMEIPKVVLPQIDKKRTSNNDFMIDLFEVANEVDKAIIMFIGLRPENKIKSDKYNILLGHMVRLYKLFDSYLLLLSDRRSEVAFVILRTLTETIINIHYLIKYIDTGIFEKYKRASLSHESAFQNVINENIRKRTKSIPIEDRMLKSINGAISRSGLQDLNDKELKKGEWGEKIEHLKTSGKAKDVGMESAYQSMYSMSSHSVHGSWHDLDFEQLERDLDVNGYRKAKMTYSIPKPQLVESICILILKTLRVYLKVVLKSQTTIDEMDKYLASMEYWFFKMMDKHEDYLKASK